MKKTKVGRPANYETPEELQKKIDEYFDGGYRTIRRVINGVGVEVPDITITDLVIYLGFADRTSFYDYEKKEEFAYTIKRARSFIEREYESLLKVNSTGAIFALKNFGWTDKTETEVYGKNGGAIGLSLVKDLLGDSIREL